MQIKKYLLCSSFCFMANALYANCDANFLCMNGSLTTCVTAPGTSCPSDIQSPVIEYSSGTWAPVISGTINFATIPSSGLTTDQDFAMTIATLDNPSASSGLYITSAAAQGETDNNYYVICNDNGICGASAGKIPYTVQYTGCDSIARPISPAGSPIGTVNLPISAASLAGNNPACNPYTPGTTAKLTFHIEPASSGTYASGSYTGSFCMTVCTTAAGCTVSSCALPP